MSTASDSAIAFSVGEASRAATEVANLLTQLDATRLSPDQWQEALAAVGEQTAVFREAAARVSDLFGLTSAQKRLLTYFVRHVGEVVTTAQLAGVSCIAEGPRRVRELRVEHGWPIESGVLRPDLQADEYILVADAPHEELAAAWRVAKEIRRMGGSGKDRLLEYLKRTCPRPADQEQLAYVAKIASWTRRMRELDEEGWEIRSNIDEPELAPGTYRLASLDRRPPRARQAIKLRHKIFERDKFTCQDCGAQPGQPGVRLEAHHILPVHMGGTNEPSNLVTLCAADHAGRHALLGGGAVSDELLGLSIVLEQPAG